MKKLDYKKSYKNKEIVRLALSLVLILIQSYIFFYVWTEFYNPLLRFPYVLKGNLFLGLIYAAIYLFFLMIFDNSLSSNNKFSTSFISLCLATILNNFMMYVMIVMPTTASSRGVASGIYLIWMTLIDFIIIFIWCLIFFSIRRCFFKPLPMLLISGEDSAKELKNKFNERKDLYNIVSTIDYESPLNEIEDKCKKFANVVIGDIPSEKRNDIMKFCFDYGINTYALPKLSDIIIKNSENIYAFDTPMYWSANEGLSPINTIIKRLMDIVISLIGIVPFLPLYIIIALIIKIQDGGPVFFLQDRITQNGKEFKVIKFRSMKADADKHGVNPTKNDDDRITFIGKFIRRFHIDELPQLLNVLVGDMSIVGPRPERKEHVEQYEREISEFRFRLKVKGGITGLAQVYGRYNTSAYDKLKLDLMYIKNYSLMLDVELMLKTIQVIFQKEHIEGFSDSQAKKMHGK